MELKELKAKALELKAENDKLKLKVNSKRHEYAKIIQKNFLPWQVCGRSTTLACFETEEKARRWIDFQQGRRYNR